MIEDIASVILPVFVMAGIGYAINRRGFRLDTEAIGRLVLLVGTPALVFSSLTSPDIPQASLSGPVSAALLATGIAAVLGALFLLAIRQPVRAFVSSLALPNSGNMGLPIVLLAFGQQGLANGVAFFFVIALVQYIFVPVIMDGNFSLGRVLREPLVYALIAVFIFRATDSVPHEIITRSTHLLGGMVIPLMVILLGYSLAGLQVSDLRLALVLALARLVTGIIAGLIVIHLLGLTGIVAGCVFLMAAMPCAMVIYLFALRYNRAPRRIAGLVVVSTLMTFAALPGLLVVGIALSEGAVPLDLLTGQW